jgi:hypothetical protein
MINMTNTNNGYHVLHDNNSETGMNHSTYVCEEKQSLTFHLRKGTSNINN